MSNIYVLPLRLGAHITFLAAILTTHVVSDFFYFTAKTVTVVFLIAANLLTRKVDIQHLCLILLTDRLTLLQIKISHKLFHVSYFE